MLNRIHTAFRPRKSFRQSEADGDAGGDKLEKFLFVSGQQIAIGAPPPPFAVDGALELPDQKDQLGRALVAGMAKGLGYATLPATEWCRLATPVEHFLSGLAAAWHSPGLEYAVFKAAERDVAHQANAYLDLRRTAARPLNLRLLSQGTKVDDGVDSVSVNLPFVRHHIDVPLYASPTGSDLARLAARVVKQELDASLVDSGRWWGLTGRAYRAQAILKRGLNRLPLKSGRQTAAKPFSAIARLAQKINADVTVLDLPCATPAPESPGEPGVGEGSQQSWDAFFERENPWKYDASYEQIKYQRTLSLLEGEKLARVLEVACAEGHFTLQLAPRAASLVATDISSKALGRAQKRCAGATNVEFRLLDAYREPLPANMDAIVCSEVLYYMEDEHQLESFVERVASALNVGGVFVHAHAFDICDDPTATGFDWDVSFAAKTISEAFSACPRLQRVKRIETELYVVESYRRVTADERHVSHVGDIERASIGASLEDSVAGSIVWNGAVRSRAHLERSVRAYDLPVLMYHRISEPGPDALRSWRITARDFEHQLRFLKRRGFYSVSPEEWQSAAVRSGSLPGRPIVLTFDDAYADFYDVAWPILRRNGFGAHVFVVTDRVGQHADWDAAHGPPAPLMNWEQIAKLAESDSITFGSHLCTHTSPDGLPTAALLEEALRSRAMLERVTSRQVETVATPFGAWDARIATTLSLAGYSRVFTITEGRAPVVGCELVTPRFGVFGEDDIASFASKLGLLKAEPPAREDEPTEL